MVCSRKMLSRITSRLWPVRLALRSHNLRKLCIQNISVSQHGVSRRNISLCSAKRSSLSDQQVDCSPSHEVQLRPSTMDDEQLVLSILRDVISYREKKMSSWIVENQVRRLLTSYKGLSKKHRESVVAQLAATYSVDQKQIHRTLNVIKDRLPITAAEEKQLKEVLTPLYMWLFKIVGRLEGGVKFLVDLRSDVLTQLQFMDQQSEYYSSLHQLNASLKELLTLWFSVGFLQLERITWKSSCEMLEKLSEYEAVHPVRNWTDIKRRVGPYRRCFVYTHSAMPTEPLVVLHTALCPDISKSTKGLVTTPQRSPGNSDSGSGLLDDSQVEDPRKIDAAIFYSITSTQHGLQGIELGNYLIKRVAQELQTEFPQLSQYSTLSPIPTFKLWLFKKLSALENGEKSYLQQLWAPTVDSFGGWKNLKKQLHDNTWVQEPALVTSLQTPLMPTCARYLYKEKRRGMALDNVANFHLRNGAVMWRLNWLADMSPRGLTNSCGLMVNYRYFLEDAEQNSRNYLEHHTIKASDAVINLISSEVTSKL